MYGADKSCSMGKNIKWQKIITATTKCNWQSVSNDLTYIKEKMNAIDTKGV